MPTSNLHVVLGAGQIGNLVAERLLARGHRVRQVRRSPGGGVTGVESVRGDVSDATFAARACEGASVVYHVMNPRYWQWDELLEPLAHGAIAGAKAAGAHLVALDNLYVFGASPDRPMSESSPIAPNTHKGELRARIHRVYLEAGAAVGRASDFFGPQITEAHLGERMWKRVLAGKPAQCLADADQPHSYAFSYDVADGLIALGERRVDGLWMLPHAAAPTTREMVGMLAGAAGLEGVKVSRIPAWPLKVAGLFSKELRELPEMTYQWEAPFTVDSSQITRELGIAPTPLRRAAELTAQWALAAYAPKKVARAA
jgi:nucleoside-diphosphate-sugar epimerase